MVFAEFGTGEVFLSMVWFFLFVIWLMILFRVFGDIFRSSDLSGLSKTLWILFVIITPYLGAFVYLIARGPKMAERDRAEAKAADAAMQDYIRSAAGSSASPAEELARLADLRDRGVIDEAEFATMKAKVLG